MRLFSTFLMLGTCLALGSLAAAGWAAPAPEPAPQRSVNPYADPAWLARFWASPDQASAELPSALRPATAFNSPGLLIGGVVLTIGGVASEVGGIVQFFGAAHNCPDPLEGVQSQRDCTEADLATQRGLAVAGMIGGVLWLGTGLSFAIVGGMDEWVDPNGDPVLYPEEVGAARTAARPAVRVDATVGPSWLGLRETF